MIATRSPKAPSPKTPFGLRECLCIVALGCNGLWSASLPAAEMYSILERPIEPVVYEGIVEAKHDIMVAATELGLLESVDVKVGDRVTSGQVIGKLDDSLQTSAVQIAELQAKMSGERDAARAELRLHQNRWEKLRILAADGIARPDELSRSKTDLDVATARYAVAQDQFELRQLELQRYRIQLERRRIRVPMNGVIASVFHKPGEYITPGDPAIVQLLVVDRLDAVFSLPIEDMGSVKVGSAARVMLRSSAQTIDATITSVSPAIDGESGTVQVRVELDNAAGKILAGDRCTLQVQSVGRSWNENTTVGWPPKPSSPSDRQATRPIVPSRQAPSAEVNRR